MFISCIEILQQRLELEGNHSIRRINLMMMWANSYIFFFSSIALTQHDAAHLRNYWRWKKQSKSFALLDGNFYLTDSRESAIDVIFCIAHFNVRLPKYNISIRSWFLPLERRKKSCNFLWPYFFQLFISSIVLSHRAVNNKNWQQIS